MPAALLSGAVVALASWLVAVPAAREMTKTTIAHKSARATRFGDAGDDLAGGTHACMGRIPDVEYAAALPYACAHRTLPCGSLIVLKFRSTVATCVVLDRGPYGTKIDGKFRLKLKKTDPGTWTSEVDLTPAVADALGLSPKIGRAVVDMWLVTHPRRPRP